jgi:hypothetical protein
MNKTESLPFVDSRFGGSIENRKVMIETLLKDKPKATHRIKFQGQSVDLPIIRVPIGLPKYRLENGRTVSLQAEYLAKNPMREKNFFSLDPEMLDSQEVQHSLLIELSRKTELRKRFEDPTQKQVEPLILDSSGFVVNGNRRLSTWRDIYDQDKNKYSHFSHVDVIVLPPCGAEDIDRLEAKLQIEKDLREDYSWDAEANMMLEKMKRDHFSGKDIADLYDMKESDIKHLLSMRDFGADYLRSRGKENLWSHISGSKFAFNTLAEMCPKIDGAANQELFKEAAFTLIDNPAEVGDSVHDAIRNLKEHFTSVKEKLLEEFEVSPIVPEGAAADLLGDMPIGPGEQVNDGTAIPLANEIKKAENSDQARQVIVEVIESQKQKKKDAKNASYLLKCCTDAHASLANAVKDGLNPESKRKGVEAQLVQIEAQLVKIKKFLEEHAHD